MFMQISSRGQNGESTCQVILSNLARRREGEGKERKRNRDLDLGGMTADVTNSKEDRSRAEGEKKR